MKKIKKFGRIFYNFLTSKLFLLSGKGQSWWWWYLRRIQNKLSCRNLSKNQEYFYSLLHQDKSPKILVSGTLSCQDWKDQNARQIFTYTYNLLKKLPYRRASVYLYDIKSTKFFRMDNADFLLNTGYYKGLYACPANQLPVDQFDIYFQVCTEEGSRPPVYVPLAYAYCVGDWEGKKLSKEFNAYFHGILSPSPIKEPSDKLPVVYLPLDVDTSWAQRQPSEEEKHKLGTICDVHDATQLVLALQNLSFPSSFQLEICYYRACEVWQLPLTPHEKDNLQFLQNFKHPHITCVEANMFQPISEIRSKMLRWDGVIFPSKIEEYRFNFQEALALGKVVFIPADYHACLPQDVPGVFRYNWTEDLAALTPVLATYFEHADELYKNQQIRRDTAAAWPSVSQTVRCLCGQEDPSLTSSVIAVPLQKRLQVIAKHYKSVSTPNITVIPANDAGFCSVLNKHVSFMAYAQPGEYVLPDWRTQTVEKLANEMFGFTHLTSWCYGQRSEGNVFYRFFEPLYPAAEIPENWLETDEMYQQANKVVQIAEYNFNQEPFLTYIYPYDLQANAQVFQDFRDRYHRVFSRYFKLVPRLQHAVDMFYEEKLKGFFCVAAHIRCQGHNLELLEGGETVLDVNCRVIRQILAQEKIDPVAGKWKLFLACDNDDAIAYFEAKFPGHCVYTKATRLSTKQEEEYRQLRQKKGHDVYGYELQHRHSGSDETRSTRLGDEILIDCYLMAKADYLVYKSSNVSTCVSYLNPKLKMIYAR